jgi:hypothetical protein
MVRAVVLGSMIVGLAACGPSRTPAGPGTGTGTGTRTDTGTGTGTRTDTGTGTGTGTGTTTGTDDQASGDGSTPAPTASCAASYATVPVGSACADTAATCAFSEGNCWCGPRRYCGGVAPPRDLLEELAKPTWQCKPFRTDGCPEARPSGACASEGQRCSYGDCCFVALTCRAGAWTQTGGGCPP